MQKLRKGSRIKVMDNGNIWRYGFIQILEEEVTIKKWQGGIDFPKRYRELQEGRLFLVNDRIMEVKVNIAVNDLGTLQCKTEFSDEELVNMDLDKGQLGTGIGLKTFDTALPQTWLNNFVKISGLNYNKVRYSTFMVYPKGDHFGSIVSAWEGVSKWL